MNENDKNNYAQKFGMVNILTPEEKSSYRSFAQKVHNMKSEDVFKLSTGMADELTTEQQDIVALEIKIRELEMFKKRNINPQETFKIENYHQDVGYDPEAPNLQALLLNERTKISEMSDELLEKSRNIIENTAVKIKQDDLHKTMGGALSPKKMHPSSGA